ncbi:hypothetical protein GF343_01780 [Candidatus Woesearchaeota archaeon]|nr:hypothetical protein [Candidatus Woesearchaeota archaeon]
MALFNWGLERFIKYVSDNKPAHVEVAADSESSGTDFIVEEHFAYFAGYYEGRKPVVARKKYGGTTSKPQEMDAVLDTDIKRMQELDIDVFKTKGFVNESD